MTVRPTPFVATDKSELRRSEIIEAARRMKVAILPGQSLQQTATRLNGINSLRFEFEINRQRGLAYDYEDLR